MASAATEPLSTAQLLQLQAATAAALQPPAAAHDTAAALAVPATAATIHPLYLPHGGRVLLQGDRSMRLVAPSAAGTFSVHDPLPVLYSFVAFVVVVVTGAHS